MLCTSVTDSSSVRVGALDVAKTCSVLSPERLRRQLCEQVAQSGVIKVVIKLLLTCREPRLCLGIGEGFMKELTFKLGLKNERNSRKRACA